MSNQYGPRITTDGLVLCLDASNSKSYPGSGTVWSDLSGNNNNGTLINGPVYSSENTKSILFDGLNDGVNLGNPALLDLNSNFTICSWSKATAFGGGSLGRIVARGTINTGGYAFYVDSSNSSIVFQIGRTSGGSTISVANTIVLNSWMFLAVTFSSTTTTIYKNNMIINQTSTNPATSVATNFVIGNRDPGYDRGFSGNIAIIQFYNQVLSSGAILQNYNATKGRFGL